MTASPSDSGGTVTAPTPDIGMRLQQLVAGWRGAERGETLSALHNQCRAAAGPGGAHLRPDRLLMVKDLDGARLHKALGRLNGLGRGAALTFRIPPAGRFDAALVPVGPAGQARDRWVLAVDEGLSPRDQVALYGHALGHLLLNREMRQMGRLPPLDPHDGYAHADMASELRHLESTRNPWDRRVLEAYPQLAALLRPEQDSPAAYSTVDPELRRRLAHAGWRGHLVTAPYVFTGGRVYVSGAGFRRGPKLRADALLRAEASLPIALVQALRPGETLMDAERQLVEYAHDRLSLPFAYLIADDGTVHEFDWTSSHEPARTTLADLPVRDTLWYRWITALGLTDEKAQTALRYPYQLSSGQTPRYYQEAAINRAVIAVLQAQRNLREPRILLTLATGTGKTLLAFQIVWKLRRTGSIGNVLFLTDRDYLLGQAMDNAFAPFGGARDRIRGAARTSRDILFATYQSLADEEGQRGLYRRYPKDFFSLIIVDECHRGSAQDDSNWRSILEHFKSAVHIGLTATPLRNDNVQTYQYFGTPVAIYSLRRGITDGFLAPYRVRRVLMGHALPAEESTESGTTAAPLSGTTVDGAHDDVSLDTGMVETAATLVERTEVIAEHLARYLRESGDPMAKTIIFCVDQDHAERMRAALARECADQLARYPDYVERIVADEGIEGKRALGRFSTPDEPTPVIVTTSKLLSTGVDVPTCKNIVLARPIGSIVEFKQIIGRGTRLHEPRKTWFTILDYAGATRHFFDPEFDGDPEGIEIEVLAPRPEPAGAGSDGASGGDGAGPLPTDGQVPAGIYGTDTQATSGSMVKEPEPAGSTLGAGAEPPAQPAPTAEVPGAASEAPPLTPPAAPTGAAPPLITGTQPAIPPVEVTSPRTDTSTPPGPHPSETDEPVTPIRPGEGRKIVVRGEIVYELGPDGRTLRTLSYRQYRDYARNVLSELCHNAVELRARWVRQEQRDEIRGRLEDAGVDLGELAAALDQPEADPLDLLLHVAFGGPLLTRRERAERLCRDHPDFFARYNAAAREILQIILTKYVQGEAPDVGDPDLLRVPPLLERGTFMELARPFGGGAGVRAALKQMQALLYAA